MRVWRLDSAPCELYNLQPSDGLDLGTSGENMLAPTVFLAETAGG